MKDFLSPPHCSFSFVVSQVTVHSRVCCRILCSGPLTYFSILLPLSQCFNFSHVIIGLAIKVLLSFSSRSLSLFLCCCIFIWTSCRKENPARIFSGTMFSMFIGTVGDNGRLQCIFPNESVVYAFVGWLNFFLLMFHDAMGNIFTFYFLLVDI